MKMKLTNNKAARTADIMRKIFLASAITMLAVILFTGAPLMLAFAEEGYEIATKLIFRIVRGICIVLGAFFMVFGVVKIAIAHQNDDGPQQNKAIMQTAVGLILIMLGTIVLTESGTVYSSILDLIKGAMS